MRPLQSGKGRDRRIRLHHEPGREHRPARLSSPGDPGRHRGAAQTWLQRRDHHPEDGPVAQIRQRHRLPARPGGGTPDRRRAARHHPADHRPGNCPRQRKCH